MQWTLRLLSTNLPQTINPVYINRVKQMSDMSYTFEQFEQDKETLLNLIADCEELEKKENQSSDELFHSMRRILPKKITLFDMNFPTSTVNVLPHLEDLRKTWRQQDFRFTKDQQEQYDMLMQARRERVAFFYESNRVQVGPKVIKKAEPQQEDQDS